MAAENPKPGQGPSLGNSKAYEFAYRRVDMLDLVSGMTSTDLGVQCERMLGPGSDQITTEVSDFKRRFESVTRLCTEGKFSEMREEGFGTSLVADVPDKNYPKIGYALPLHASLFDPRSERYLMLFGTGQKKKVLVIEAGYTVGPQRRFNEILEQHALGLIIRGKNPVDTASEYISRLGVKTLYTSDDEAHFPKIEKAIDDALSIVGEKRLKKTEEVIREEREKQVQDLLGEIEVFENDKLKKNN